MLIQLPAETWIEILDWLKRRDLVKKLDKLWDRQFTPIVQDWLHKYTRNVSIGILKTNNDGLSVLSCGDYLKVPFAEVELPKNITSFKWINISYMDSNILAFLRRMSPLFHNNICLRIDYIDLEPTQTALRALMPVIDSESIESLTLDRAFLQYFLANYPLSTLLNVKLMEIWGFEFESIDASEPMTNWLFTPREDGKPRTLVLYGHSVHSWEKIRERFLDLARQTASPFFVRIRNNPPNLLPLVFDNVHTGEQLTVNGELISNCALNVDQKWLAKKTEEVLKWHALNEQKVIWLDSPKIGRSLYAKNL